MLWVALKWFSFTNVKHFCNDCCLFVVYLLLLICCYCCFWLVVVDLLLLLCFVVELLFLICFVGVVFDVLSLICCCCWLVVVALFCSFILLLCFLVDLLLSCIVVLVVVVFDMLLNYCCYCCVVVIIVLLFPLPQAFMFVCFARIGTPQGATGRLVRHRIFSVIDWVCQPCWSCEAKACPRWACQDIRHHRNFWFCHQDRPWFTLHTILPAPISN